MIARQSQTFRSILCSAAGLLAALTVFATDEAQAETQQTTWTADSGYQVSGRVLGHDGTYLRLETAAGPITINPAGLTCDGSACPPPGLSAPTWRIVGAERIGDSLFPSLIEGFAFANGYEATRQEPAPGQTVYDLSDRATGDLLGRVALELRGSASGLDALQAHEADGVLHVGAVPEDMLAAAQEAGLGDLGQTHQVHVLALDALVPIASGRADLAQISLDELAAAFGAEPLSDADPGGIDESISLHLHRSDHAAWFAAQILSGAAISGTVTRHDTASALSQVVASEGAALGLVPYRDWGAARPVPIAGRCGIRIAADAVSLRTRDYPLTMPLVLVLPDRRRPPLADAFLRWLKTERAEAVVRRAGFVDLGITPIPIEQQGARLAEAIARAGPDVSLRDLQAMTTAFEGRARLSPTFRFVGDTLALDLPSSAAVEELAREISDGRFDGQTLLFAGFSDGQAAANASRAMSGARAEAVMAALVSALGGSLPDGVRLRIRAFGEALPMGCDDTEWGRTINRRVELWTDE